METIRNWNWHYRLRVKKRYHQHRYQTKKNAPSLDLEVCSVNKRIAGHGEIDTVRFDKKINYQRGNYDKANCWGAKVRSLKVD
jgi:hypothetical protein